MDFSDANTTNSNYKYLLIGIDVFKRKNIFRTNENKEYSVIDAINKNLKIVKPKKIQCGSGSKFIAKSFRDLMSKYNIEIQYIDIGDSINKLGVINRY